MLPLLASVYGMAHSEQLMAPSALCPRGGSGVHGGNDGTLRSHDDYMQTVSAETHGSERALP